MLELGEKEKCVPSMQEGEKEEAIGGKKSWLREQIKSNFVDGYWKRRGKKGIEVEREKKNNRRSRY